MATINMLSTFIKALGSLESGPTRVAGQALAALLPRLKASDSALVSSDDQHLLCRELERIPATYSSEFNADLAIAIIRALEQIGDADAIPYVERIADNVDCVRSQRPIREAAIECLPGLLMRAEAGKAGRTLLRPVETDPGLLLRAAGGSDADASQLLRAAEGGA